MIRCAMCKCALDERKDIRYNAGPVTLCTPACIVEWRKKTGNW